MNASILGAARRWALAIRVSDYGRCCRQLGIDAGEGAPRRRLELVTRTVFAGYHAALECPEPEALRRRLRDLAPLEREGFAHEGASMALAVLDFLDPLRRRRFDAFLQSETPRRRVMLQLGYGLASGKLPWARVGVMQRMRRFDALTRWYVIDAFGFHDGMFRYKRTVVHRRRPDYITGYARRAYDQGTGRSLWFSCAAKPAKIAATIASFPAARQNDLWAGVGFASAYAGGADAKLYNGLAQTADSRRPALAAGTTLAAYWRRELEHEADHTALAAQIVCQRPATDAADLAATLLSGIADSRTAPAHAVWHDRLNRAFASGAASESSRHLEIEPYSYGGPCRAC